MFLKYCKFTCESVLFDKYQMINKLINLSHQTKYLKWYVSLVTKQYNDPGYTEKHHILPKSLGGDNSKSNVVRIPGRVHFICHKLLVRMVVDSRHKKNMIHALNMLAKSNNKNQSRYQVSSKEYEHIRKQLSASMKGENNPMFGKPAPNRGVTHSEETRRKLSEANKRHFATNPGTLLGVPMRESTKEKLRRPKTETAKQAMSVAARKKPRIVCLHCGRSFTTSNHTRWHGSKCKGK